MSHFVRVGTGTQPGTRANFQIWSVEEENRLKLRMEYYEDEDEQFGYNDVSGDDLKKKILSLGISAYSGGNDAPGNLLPL